MKPCKHCGIKPRGEKCRVLCCTCFKKLDIRKLYPAFYPRQPWTKSDIKLLLASKDASEEELAKAMNRTKNSIRKARGIYKATTYCRPDEETLIKMKEMVENGESTTIIAKKLGFNYETIKRHTLRWGYQIKHLTKEELKENLRERYNKTLEQNEVISLQQIRSDITRAKNAIAGWPQAETELQLRILQALNEKVPMKAIELSKLLDNTYEDTTPVHLYKALKVLIARNIVKVDKIGRFKHYSLAIKFGDRL